MRKAKKNKRWEQYEYDYIRENYGKLSLRLMADYLSRSEMSVRQFILRKRISCNGIVKRNLLVELLRIRFKNLEDFTPSRAFYVETGIGQKHFRDLLYGRKAITGEEYAAVAKYFDISISEAMESRQLNLFLKND